jgi:FAD/FMN-containing dehydrogenase
VMGLGEGYLTPRYGFGCDNVLAFELVTADGKVLQVSADENPELFWAMRGAGANFGVVTALKLRLHPLPERTIGGWVRFSHHDVPRVTRHVWEMMKSGSEYFFPFAVFELDESREVHVRVFPGHTGPDAVAKREVDQLRRVATPISDDIRTMSYIDLIREIGDPEDEESNFSKRQIWDIYRFDLDALPERQIEVLLEQAQLLTPFSHFTLWRTAPTDAPTPPSVAPRFPGINLFLPSYWHEAADDDDQMRWLQATAAAFKDAGVVSEAANAMNHVSILDERRLRRLYGDVAYERIASLKAELDPTNFFHRNCNIPPAR